jgi:hypothetical protein
MAGGHDLHHGNKKSASPAAALDSLTHRSGTVELLTRNDGGASRLVISCAQNRLKPAKLAPLNVALKMQFSKARGGIGLVSALGTSEPNTTFSASALRTFAPWNTIQSNHGGWREYDSHH